MTEPWIERDAERQAHRHLARRGPEHAVLHRRLLDDRDGGKAELPMDVIEANQKFMLRDLAIAGLTASGGQCLWDDLYRQFQREGTASMRFFCFRTVPPAAVAQASSSSSSPKSRT